MVANVNIPANAEKLIMENVEVAAGVVAGAMLYVLAAPYVSGMLSFVPAQFQPIVLGLGVGILGYFAGQKLVIGLGSGMVAYGMITYGVTVATPLVQSIAKGA